MPTLTSQKKMMCFVSAIRILILHSLFLKSSILHIKATNDFPDFCIRFMLNKHPIQENRNVHVIMQRYDQSMSTKMKYQPNSKLWDGRRLRG